MVEALVWPGTLVFAATGALKGVEKGFDLLGVLVLATVTAVGGGSIRDALVGTIPPSALRNEPLLWSVALTGLLVFRFHPRVQALERPIYYLDTLGLGLFAALGAERGLEAGLGPFGVALAGTLSGVGCSGTCCRARSPGSSRRAPPPKAQPAFSHASPPRIIPSQILPVRGGVNWKA